MSTGAVVVVRQFGGKAETKMKPHLERTLQHTQLPASQECEVWGKEGVGKRHQGFFYIILTERETEARCPDLLGGFRWVLQSPAWSGCSWGKLPSREGWGFLQG